MGVDLKLSICYLLGTPSRYGKQLKMDNISTNQTVSVLKRLLTNWFLLPSISLIILGIFRFKDNGLIFWFLCGDVLSCQPLQMFKGYLIILFRIVSCLTPGLLLVMIFRGLYRLPMLVLGIGALPIVFAWFLLLLRGVSIENILLFTLRDFTYWISSGTAQAILLIIYVTAFLIFKLLSSFETVVMSRLRRWVLSSILLIAGIWIVIGVVAPQAFIVAERKVVLKTEGLQSGVLYYYKSRGLNPSTIYRLKQNNQRESIDISPCKTSFVMISWDQKLVFCRVIHNNPSRPATLASVNLVTGERRTSEVYGGPLNQYSWSLDGKSLLFSRDGIEATNALYSLNPENMQFSEIYRLDKPGQKIDGAIYSPDKRRIAFLSEDEQGKDSLFIMDTNGSMIKQVPLIGVDCAKIVSCKIYFLKFSKASSKIFYGVGPFYNGYYYIFNLYDIETGINEQIRLSEIRGSFRDSLKSTDALLFYDGERSIIYLDLLGKKLSLSRHSFGDSQAKPMNVSYGPVRSSPDAQLSSNGEWLFYRDFEGSNTFSTWAIRTSDGQRFRIMNESEFILVNDAVQPHFAYWFPS